MTKEYKQKNPYFKNARIGIAETEQIIYMFVRGIKASFIAKKMGISEPSIYKIYEKLRKAISSNGFYFEVSMSLYEDEYIHWSLFNELRTRLMNATSSQVMGCTRFCSTDTPPLVVRKNMENNNFEWIKQARMKCHSCSLKLYDYSPVRTTITYNRKMFQPYHEYEEDDHGALIEFWVEILNYLADYRRVDENKIKPYIFQAILARLLKRSEYKVTKNLIFGFNVPELFLEEKQKKDVEDGWTYQTRMDGIVMNYLLDYLKENPM